MILIWDNGLNYSDHAIHFIDIGSHDAAPIEKLLAQHPRATDPHLAEYEKPYVIAVCAEVTWRRLEAVTSLKDFCESLQWQYSAHPVWCAQNENAGHSCSCWVAELSELASRP